MRPSRLLVALPLAAALSFAGLVGEGASALPLAVKAVDGGVPAAAATAPAAPAKPALTAHGTTSIDVRWATPASDGGAPVSGYAVRYGITGSSTRLLRLGGDVLATRLTGLTAHGRYKVTVQAENGVGLSAPSVVARLRLQKPNRVARPAVRAGSSSTITARWTAPKTAGGPAVIAYQVRLYRSGHLTKAVSVAPSRRSVT